jgi:tetratricopeptide (TPR) repeat protein
MPRRQPPEMSTDDSLRYFRLLRTHPEQYLRIAEEMILKHPEDAQGYLDCAHYYVEMERFEEALRALDQAMAAEPNHMLIPFRRGSVLLRARRYQEALTAFDDCVRDWRWTRDGCLYACRATCHAYLGDLDAVLAECAKISNDYFLPEVYGQFGGDRSQIIETAQRVAQASKTSNWIEGPREEGNISDDED